MKITLALFKTIDSVYAFHPGFLDLMIGMGYKSAPDDEHFISCYCNIRSKKDCSDSASAYISGKYHGTSCVVCNSRTHASPQISAIMCITLSSMVENLMTRGLIDSQ